MKANLIIGVFIIGVLGLGYWAFGSITARNASLIEGTASVDVGPIVSSDPGVPVTTYVPPVSEPTMENPAPATNPTETPAPTETNKNSALIDKLQGLIDDNILMKKGSRGTRVGTVQEFLKLYGAKVTVDNDYGDTTVTAVKKFQVDQKLSADGQAGPTTYQKMIEWLREN